MSSNRIKVEIRVNRSIEDTWTLWNEPNHIMRWNFASADWYTPYAKNNLKTGGNFLFRMSARDGSEAFDFEGTYIQVEKEKSIAYQMSDGRKVTITFKGDKKSTLISEEFDPEQINSLELQKAGWQSILENFKKYAETTKLLHVLKFSTVINAPIGLVYKTMIADQTYRQWTSAFEPTSHYIGDWSKDSLIRFIGQDEKGNHKGMLGRIRENILNEYISIEHFGLIDGNKEITSGPEVEQWAGALENYSFTVEDSKTRLEVCVDTNSEYKEHFTDIWPKALKILKDLCEKLHHN